MRHIPAAEAPGEGHELSLVVRKIQALELHFEKREPRRDLRGLQREHANYLVNSLRAVRDHVGIGHRTAVLIRDV